MIVTPIIAVPLKTLNTPWAAVNMTIEWPGQGVGLSGPGLRARAHKHNIFENKKKHDTIARTPGPDLCFASLHSGRNFGCRSELN